MKFKPKSIYKRDYANYKEESFIEDVSIQTWNTNVQSDTNYKFNDFYWRLEGCIDRHAPSKNWIRNNWINYLNLRSTILFLKWLNIETDYSKKKTTPLIFILRAHISYFVIVSQEIKKAKKEYFKQFFEDNLNNMKKTWQGIKTY